MNKKLSIPIFLILLILIIAAANYCYYFIYQKAEVNQDSENQDNQEGIIDEQENAQEPASNFLEGVFQKQEDNFAYVIPKDEEDAEKIKLTEETVFSEVIFSSQLEVIEEKEIDRSVIKEGNPIVVFFSSDDTTEDKIALALKRIIVENE
jgi:cell division protein YceG involved in septum cleavage